MSNILSIIIIIIFSLFSYRGDFYYFLQNHFRPPIAFLIDQGSFVVIGGLLLVIFIFYFDKKKQSLHLFKKFIKENRLILLILLTLGLISRYLILSYYFFAEDSLVILRPTKNDLFGEKASFFDFSSLLNGYPFFPLVLVYHFFKTNVLYYNLFSLFLYLAGALIFYGFAFVIAKNKLVAFLATSLYLTTTTYLDSFSWHGNSQGTSLIIILLLASLVFYKLSQRGVFNWRYIISLFFFSAALKIGFVRAAGTTLAFLLIDLLFPSSEKKGSFFSLFRWSFSRFAPFLILSAGYFHLRFGSVFGWLANLFSGQRIGLNKIFNLKHYLNIFTYYFGYLVFPGPAMKPVINFVHSTRDLFFQGVVIPSIILILSYLALSLMLLTMMIIFVKTKNLGRKVLLFSFFWIVANIFYIPLFGSVTDDVKMFDVRFTSTVPPYGPGKRYVHLAYFGMALFLAQLTVCLSKLLKKHKNRILKRFSLAPYLLMMMIILFQLKLSRTYHERIVKGISIPDRALIDSFFKMVPQDGKKKLVYAINPTKNKIDVQPGAAKWLEGFYNIGEILYTKDQKEVEQLLADNEYQKENFYAFYFNSQTLAFTDLSFQARQLFFSKEKGFREIKLDFNSNKAVSKFSFVSEEDFYTLTRATLISHELKLRMIAPQNLFINLNINRIPPKFPFTDVVIAKKKFKRELWEKTPFPQPIITGGEVHIKPNFALTSFNGRLIQEIPLADKLEIMKIIKQQEAEQENIKIPKIGKYSQRQIDEFSKKFFWYVDGQETFNQLLKLKQSHQLSLVYACAEDWDWETQKDLNKLMQEVWQIKIISFSPQEKNLKIEVPFSCYGSVLRKLMIIGPPYPVEIEIEQAMIK